MAKELEKQYNPSEVENRTYDFGAKINIFMPKEKRTKNIYNSYSASEYHRSASYGSRP